MAIAMGGASGAVSASAHAGCARFRGTDPLITGQSRRKLANQLPVPDLSAGIQQARWLRAMTFESLVRDEAFASKIATTTTGSLGFPRPKAVTIINGNEDVATTQRLLVEAQERAVSDNIATLIHKPAVPFPGFDLNEATKVLPDFVVVVRDQNGADDAVVIVGDAKDYERVRSRIDDARMLKGFIQVAFGAEAFAQWPGLPTGLTVHESGVLAVPRNSFLQPTAVVEKLADHREEVRMRLEERLAEANEVQFDQIVGERVIGNGQQPSAQQALNFVEHLKATFEPAACGSCSLFGFCRSELRSSTEPDDFLTELGVPPHLRKQLHAVVEGSDLRLKSIPPRIESLVRSTLSGVAIPTGQLRIDPVGESGTINVVIAKSDGAALGVHGIAIQVVDDSKGDWSFHTFDVPQADATRRAVMGALGSAINQVLQTSIPDGDAERPVHIVVPDSVTADVLVSIADSLAGIELSRLRWLRDEEMGRPPLTFDGNPAIIPPALTPKERLAVSFLLEEDRARAFTLRSTTVDLRDVMNQIISVGGPLINRGRLDYLVAWTEASRVSPVDARSTADAIEASVHTPGARLSNSKSDELSAALGLGKGKTKPGDYDGLVLEELSYKCGVVDRALDFLALNKSSRLRSAFRASEADAQAIWKRRLNLQANDLVRFASTARFWRSALVETVEADALCNLQLRSLVNPEWVEERARDAGVREVATATVIATSPLTLDVNSRRLVAGTRIVVLRHNDTTCLEADGIKVDLLGGSFKVSGLPAGPLTAVADEDAPVRRVIWSPVADFDASVGDELVIADFDWYCDNVRMGAINVKRPKHDSLSAPKPTCDENTFQENPDAHQWCCKPHVIRESEFSDIQAAKREAGELNPQAWPPVVDADSFDVGANGEANAENVKPAENPIPEDATVDDLD